MQPLNEDKKLYWPIDKVYPWEKNPRTVEPEQLQRLISQIKKLGEYKPLIITPEGEIIGGNMRYQAYTSDELKDKYQKVWVSIVDVKTEDEKLQYALSDNDRVGRYVQEDLHTLFKDMPKDVLADFEDFSIDLGEQSNINDLLTQLEKGQTPEQKKEKQDDVEEPDEKAPAISEYGKVYQLGKHRLMCGDALKVEDVETLLDGQHIDFVFTDPPYNVGYDYATYDDNKSYSDYKQFCTDWYNLLVTVADFICITPGSVNQAMWAEIAHWKSIGTWLKKNTLNSGEVSFLRLCEPLVFYGKPKKRRNTDLFEYPLIILKEMEHTCPKPVDLIADMIRSFDASNILDIFGGSGSTLIAAEKEGIPCYMLELDPIYVDAIRKRYAKYVGESDWESATPEIT